MIIGITGLKGSGKTTAARILQEMIPGSKIISFAQPIKDMARVFLQNFVDDPDEYLFGSKKENVIPGVACTARKIMQTLGTDWGRDNISEDVWLNILRNKIAKNPEGDYIIDDVRFFNELNLILRMQGFCIKLERDGCGGDSHKSERDVNRLRSPMPLFSRKFFYIKNNNTLPVLESNLKRILEKIKKHKHHDCYAEFIKRLYGDGYIYANKVFVVKEGQHKGKLAFIKDVRNYWVNVKFFTPCSNYSIYYRANVLSESMTFDELYHILGV